MGWPVRYLQPNDDAEQSQRPPRILLSAHDNGLRTLLVHLLQRSRYDVTALKSGIQLAKYLIAARVHSARVPDPDVIILDADVPGHGIVDLLNMIGRLRRDVPVILLCAEEMDLSEVYEDRLHVVVVPKRPVRWTALSHHIARAHRQTGERSDSLFDAR